MESWEGWISAKMPRIPTGDVWEPLSPGNWSAWGFIYEELGVWKFWMGVSGLPNPLYSSSPLTGRWEGGRMVVGCSHRTGWAAVFRCGSRSQLRAALGLCCGDWRASGCARMWNQRGQEALRRKRLVIRWGKRIDLLEEVFSVGRLFLWKLHRGHRDWVWS